jgi:hypothetical protein
MAPGLLKSPGMRSMGLTILVAAIVLFAAPRSARACGSGGGGYGALAAMVVVFEGVAIASLAADVGMTFFDGASAVDQHRRSRAYGIVELSMAGGQLAFGMMILSQRPYPTLGLFSSTNPTPWLIYTGWMALLATHGIWTIATGSWHETLPPGPEGPLPEAAAPRKLLQIAFGPTYAPLGNRAQPGFGVVGRF